MTTLQAARAKALGFPEDVAKSFGLNRAIFYAAAKRGSKGGGATHPGMDRTYRITPIEKQTKTVKKETVGNEVAYFVDMKGKKRFVIGDEVLEPKDFEAQVEQRFGGTFDKAWHDATAYINRFNRETLESQRKFYEQVYKPKRDDFTKLWSNS